MGWNDETGHPLFASNDKKKLEKIREKMEAEWEAYVLGDDGENDNLYEMVTIGEVELI